MLPPIRSPATRALCSRRKAPYALSLNVTRNGYPGLLSLRTRPSSRSPIWATAGVWVPATAVSNFCARVGPGNERLR
jgi:hypothetical protein